MNWYRLEIVRDTLRLDYGAALAPSAIGRSNLEVWQRTVAGHLLVAFVRYEGQEFLVHEAVLLVAADALRVSPPGELLNRIKARGGLWTGPASGVTDDAPREVGSVQERGPRLAAGPGEV